MENSTNTDNILKQHCPMVTVSIFLNQAPFISSNNLSPILCIYILLAKMEHQDTRSDPAFIKNNPKQTPLICLCVEKINGVFQGWDLFVQMNPEINQCLLLRIVLPALWTGVSWVTVCSVLTWGTRDSAETQWSNVRTTPLIHVHVAFVNASMM